MARSEVLFLFKSGRRSRLAEQGPREFFYGFSEMRRLGLPADLLEESEMPPPFLEGAWEQVATRLLDPLSGLNASSLTSLARRDTLNRLNRKAAIVATTNAQGLALGALKSLGLIEPPVLFLPMGVWPLKAGPMRGFMSAKWLKALSLAPISRAEEHWLKARLGKAADISYLPFGIDTQFWSSGPDSDGTDEVFSIGNDLNRDWATLSAAWTGQLPPLTIVTRRPVPESAGRIEVLAGDWNSRPYSDAGIRDFYRRAKFVVLPVQETIQPSGQSACLQAMACGKAVVLSRISGLWDDELLQDEKTCLLVPPGDPLALALAAERLDTDLALRRRLGEAARSIVCQRFAIEIMGEAMAARLHVLIAHQKAGMGGK